MYFPLEIYVRHVKAPCAAHSSATKIAHICRKYNRFSHIFFLMGSPLPLHQAPSMKTKHLKRTTTTSTFRRITHTHTHMLTSTHFATHAFVKSTSLRASACKSKKFDNMRVDWQTTPLTPSLRALHIILYIYMCCAGNEFFEIIKSKFCLISRTKIICTSHTA